MSDQEKPFEFSPLQEKWLQALESGEYGQCRLALRDGAGGHCCLGVACEVLGYEPRGAQYLDADGVGVGGALNEREKTLLGLRSIWGELAAPIEQENSFGLACLSDLNDYGRMTFAEIAAYIRANPRNVFVEAPCNQN